MPDEAAAVEEHLARVRELVPGRLLSATLFGSKAHGDADPESEVDLLLVLDADSRPLRSELQSRVLLGTGRTREAKSKHTPLGSEGSVF